MFLREIARPLMARVKQTTGIVGLDVVPNAREVLIELYSKTLKEIQAVPKDEGYRKAVESFTRQRLQVCREEDWEAIEKRLGCGQVRGAHRGGAVNVCFLVWTCLWFAYSTRNSDWKMQMRLEFFGIRSGLTSFVWLLSFFAFLVTYFVKGNFDQDYDLPMDPMARVEILMCVKAWCLLATATVSSKHDILVHPFSIVSIMLESSVVKMYISRASFLQMLVETNDIVIVCQSTIVLSRFFHLTSNRIMSSLFP
ncbi:putative NADH:ubiquinone reductase (H(+)-translocating) [Rosa chinensis]|uniref:Putative NADH:ubiquinone reductase (H(+)-translocating) n=1 Tax=Rosa chinensis TaxID=74649 RepID=A0A2P6SJ47_ROSCH|nr:putative NADH:ubiquinone reductase (H(+)-translocating) [Rosa chinensis]